MKDSDKNSSVIISGGPSDLMKDMNRAKENGQHMIIETGLKLPDEFELDDITIKKLENLKSRG